MNPLFVSLIKGLFPSFYSVSKNGVTDIQFYYALWDFSKIRKTQIVKKAGFSRFSLTPQSEFLNKITVTVKTVLLQVIQQCSSLTNHF